MHPTVEALDVAYTGTLKETLNIAVEQTSAAGTAGKRSIASVELSFSQWLQVRIHTCIGRATLYARLRS